MNVNEYLSRSTADKAEKATPDSRSIAINTFFVPTSWGRDPPAQRAGPDLQLEVGSTTSIVLRVRLTYLLFTGFTSRILTSTVKYDRSGSAYIFQAWHGLRRASLVLLSPCTRYVYTLLFPLILPPSGLHQGRTRVLDRGCVPCFAVILSDAVSLYRAPGQGDLLCTDGRQPWADETVTLSQLVPADFLGRYSSRRQRIESFHSFTDNRRNQRA